WEGLPGGVYNHLLHYRVAAAGIFPFAAGDNCYTNCLIVGRPDAIKDLLKCWDKIVRGVTEKSMDCKAGSVVENAPQSDLLLFGKLVLRHLPRVQVSVNVGVERQPAFLAQMQSPDGSHSFADGARLEQRVRRHRRSAAL